MISWSTRRQFLYITVAAVILFLSVALPTYFVVYKAPSCSDGVQNHGEQGIDCGGPCALICKSSALDIIVHWQRAFRVKDGVYNALAYVENPNIDSGIGKISYRFKLYDSENILIYERDGQTFIPPNKIFGIFESNILTGSRIPARTLFEFLGEPIWQKNYAVSPALSMGNKLLSEQDGLPRLTATLENHEGATVDNIEVVAIVYDSEDNAIASSRTIVDSLERGGTSDIVFTWPEPFVNTAVRTELTYRVLR